MYATTCVALRPHATTYVALTVPQAMALVSTTGGIGGVPAPQSLGASPPASGARRPPVPVGQRARSDERRRGRGDKLPIVVRATLYVGTALVVLACGGESERSDPDACNDAASMKKQILDEAAKLGVTAPCEQPDGSPTYAHFAPACEMYEAKRAECCEAGPAQC